MPSKSSLGQGYEVHSMKKKPSAKGGFLISTHCYRFKTRFNRFYIVEVEQYQHHVYIIKFYLKNHRNSPNKFSLMTNYKDQEGQRHFDNDGFRIMSTCVRIMLRIREADPLASGGFIGANRVGEGMCNTKRFQIYRQLAVTFFDPKHFYHYPNVAESAYFIQARNNPDALLLQKAELMFNELYVLPNNLFVAGSGRTAGVG